jgi:hypothetical protein
MESYLYSPIRLHGVLLSYSFTLLNFTLKGPKYILEGMGVSIHLGE